MASSRRTIWTSRFFKRLVVSLALCVLPALAREAPAAEVWVYPSANTTWAISGDYTVTNDATTRFDWSYPDNAAPTTASPSGTDPKVKLAFIPQVTGAVSCTFEFAVANAVTGPTGSMTTADGSYSATFSGTQGQMTEFDISTLFQGRSLNPGYDYLGLKVN